MTDVSFRDLLPELRPFIPHALIDDHWLGRLAERMGHLPGMATAIMTALEIRLGDPVRAADCSVSVGPDRPLMPYYVSSGEAAVPGSAAARLGQLLARLDDSADSSRSVDLSAISGVLLEYDIVDVPPGTHAEPGVFLGLKHEADQARSLAVAIGVLMEAVGWSHRDVAVSTSLVFDALPTGSGISNLGAMPDRRLQAIKIVAVRIASGEVLEFLDRAGWPGPISQVEEVIRAMTPVTSHLALSMDVTGQGLLPRLGLEFMPPAFEKGGLAWRPLIERVEELGWCLPEKKRAIIGFPGMERVFRDDGLYMLYRGINHVKLTVANDNVQAKVYIGFSYFPFSERRWLPPVGNIAAASLASG